MFVKKLKFLKYELNNFRNYLLFLDTERSNKCISFIMNCLIYFIRNHTFSFV